LTVDGTLSALSIVLCGFLSSESPEWAVMVLLILTGGFRSLGLTSLFTLPFVDLAPTQRSAATTLMNITQQMGFGLGVAFGSVALQASLLLRGAGEDALSAFDFRIAFAAVALVGALALPGFLSLSPYAGTEVSGHRSPAADPAEAEG
jgi:predicted MFS family arabinose efflux permease